MKPNEREEASFYSCNEGDHDLSKLINKNIPEVTVFLKELHTEAEYRDMAEMNVLIYEKYQKGILKSDDNLRNSILMSLIVPESLEASCLDQLGSVAGSILNDRSSQAPTSCFDDSIRSESM